MIKLLKSFWENEDGFFPIIALAAAAIGAALQTYASVESAGAAKDAEKARRGSEELTKQRERLQAVREARIRRAEVASAAEQQGASGSSGAVGAQASIGTQLQSNLGFIESQANYAGQQSAAQLRFNRAGLISGFGGSLGNLGGAVADFGYRQQQNAAQSRPATRVPFPGDQS